MRKATISRNSEDASLLTTLQAQRRYQLSRTLIDRVGKEANAKVKVGRSVRFDRERLDAYFAMLAETL